MQAVGMLSRRAAGAGLCAIAWRGVGLAVMFCCGLLVAAGGTADAAEANRSGTTSRAARQDAVRAIPLDRLDADARAKAASVVQQNSLFRRMPVASIDCDPDLYLFLLRHPEVVVDIWQLMGITDLKLQRTGPESFHATDNAGTSGDVEFLYGDQQLHIVYIRGQYRGPLYPRTITANCVLVLQSRFVRDKQGRAKVISQLDSFVDVKNFGVELVARTLQNVFGHTTDHNFEETAGFIGSLSQLAERNPSGVQRMTARLKGIDPQTRADFTQLTTQIGARKRASLTARQAAPSSPASGRSVEGPPAAEQPSPAQDAASSHRRAVQQPAEAEDMVDQDPPEEPPLLRAQAPSLRR